MIRYIMVPIVGALIGYATNWIAVKMLFRPHYEVRVFGFKLPFTPGVIPRGQGRLARAVGRAVEEQLLTGEVLEKVLLSPDMKDRLAAGVDAWIKKQELSEKTLMETACMVTTEEQVSGMLRSLEDHMTETIFRKLVDMNIGHIVSEKVLEAAREKLAESMFGMMLGGSMLEPIAEMVEAKVNEYVEDHAEEYIRDMLIEETEKLKEKPAGETVALLGQYEIDLPAYVVSVYTDLVQKKLPELLSVLKLSSIVEDRINAMEVAEVEELLLSIMKKELGAIINLGALIGFVLGLINVAILLL
ncbi:MAG: DUF445 family protein [Eubacterium sp.]|nr:DUF445 family protein [Eubacterium sp.]